MQENDLIIDLKNIEKRIFTIRGKQVMIDRDLAELYAVQTKRINEQMKRNINRFPLRFCFQLSINELNKLVAKCDRFYKLKPDTGIFFDGQIFDAYTFISDIIRKADKSIILIDNYIDDSVLTLLSKRKDTVKIIIYTKTISNQLKLDSAKFNSQFNNLEVKLLTEAHDRFLIIDENELYHIGASLKDLGKKWFAFSKMNLFTIDILKRLNQDKMLINK